MCDHQLLVRDLYVGEAGSMNDARVFRRSPLFRQLLTNPNMLEPNQHLIGDSIYMQTDKLLKPSRDNGHLTRGQKLYNYCLSKCRVRVEHCFGKLFSQWRRLKFMHVFDFEYAVETIVSSFVLQNLMILSGVELAEEIEEKQENVDGMLEQVLEGDYDELPEEFLIRHPLIHLIRQAKVDGVEKSQQVMEYLLNRRNPNECQYSSVKTKILVVMNYRILKLVSEL